MIIPNLKIHKNTDFEIKKGRFHCIAYLNNAPFGICLTKNSLNIFENEGIEAIVILVEGTIKVGWHQKYKIPSRDPNN